MLNVDINTLNSEQRALYNTLIQAGPAMGFTPRLLNAIMMANLVPQSAGRLSMSEWGIAARKKGIKSRFIKSFEETAEERIFRAKRVTELLPHYRTVNGKLEDFLHNPEYFFSRLSPRTNLLIFKLLKVEDGSRQTALGLTKEQIMSRTRELAINCKRSDFNIILTEYIPNWLGLSVVVQKDGQIFLEVCLGKHENLAHARGRSIITGRSGPFRKYLSLSMTRGAILTEHEFEFISRVVRNTVLLLPRSDSSSFFQPCAGYYEGILGVDLEDRCSPMKPYFFDMDEDPDRVRFYACA